MPIEDYVPFVHDFAVRPEGKAASVTELEDGDLIIEGWAANFEGVDRENENFTDGAFKRGIKSFLNSQAALCYHHKHDMALGKVLELQEVEGKGLWMKARVDRQVEGSPLWHIYNGIKKGTLSGLSAGGFFKRKMTPEGLRIADVDFTEISVTPVPIHAGTNFAVVAGKALETPAQPVSAAPVVTGTVSSPNIGMTYPTDSTNPLVPYPGIGQPYVYPSVPQPWQQPQPAPPYQPQPAPASTPAPAPQDTEGEVLTPEIKEKIDKLLDSYEALLQKLEGTQEESEEESDTSQE